MMKQKSKKIKNQNKFIEQKSIYKEKRTAD